MVKISVIRNSDFYSSISDSRSDFSNRFFNLGMHVDWKIESKTWKHFQLFDRLWSTSSEYKLPMMKNQLQKYDWPHKIT